MISALKASVSYPGIFPPYEAWGSQWLSGSSIWNIDVAAPVIQCLAMGFKQEDIVIDAIIDSANQLDEEDVQDFNSLQIGWRTLEVMKYYGAR